MSPEADKKNWVGKSLPRKEENRLLRGRGKFSDDIKLREMLYLRFIRSPYAHAKIVSIDVSGAEALPGVVCALTGTEVAQQTQPFIEIGPDPFAKIKDYPLAVSKARYQGEPLAAVVAESPALADDAAELVQVDYDPLDPVVDAEDALTNKSLLHEEAGTNLVWNGVFEYGDVEKAFRDAAYRGQDRSPAFPSLLQHAAGEQRSDRSVESVRMSVSITSATTLSRHLQSSF